MSDTGSMVSRVRREGAGEEEAAMQGGKENSDGVCVSLSLSHRKIYIDAGSKQAQRHTMTKFLFSTISKIRSILNVCVCVCACLRV